MVTLCSVPLTTVLPLKYYSEKMHSLVSIFHQEFFLPRTGGPKGVIFENVNNEGSSK